MEPEKGDKNTRVTENDVAGALATVGIQSDDTVIFHSSLSSMGTVVDGANTVINGFIRAVGPEGTVAAPTLWWHPADPPLDIQQWNIDTSPSYVGSISEALRKRSDSIRSNHPTHSISAIGSRAAELTRDHGHHGPRPCPWGWGAFGVSSPWQRLYDWDAAISFIGVDLRVGTMRHFAEAVLTQTLLDQIPPARRDALASRLINWGKPGVWPYIDGLLVDRRLTAAGKVTFGRMGSATLRLIRSRSMVDTLLQMMTSDPPETWFRPDFVEWFMEARGH